MAKLTLTDISGGYLSVGVFNTNNSLIEAAMENTLSRDGTSPNQMNADLDMNSYDINNINDATQNQQPVSYAQFVAASGSLSTVPASLVTIVDAGGLYASDNVEGALQEVTFSYAQSALETTNGITPTDLTYIWGDVRRYGAVADAVAGSGGTDNTSAFQDAVDSGHPVYIPEGYWAVEGTVEVFSPGGADGGLSVKGCAQARVEKFTNANTDPIFHIVGSMGDFDGGGMTIAVREYGGYDKGVVLFGHNPTAVDNTDTSCLDTSYASVGNFRILGKLSNTGQDGTIGLFVHSAGRRRGEFISPTTLNMYYNRIHRVNVQQVDYAFVLSTDANANSVWGCNVQQFGTAGFYINGYGNQITACTVEGGSAWDTRERAAYYMANKDDGPEGSFGADYECDEDTPTVAILSVTKGNPTTITCSSAHGLTSTDKVRLKAIVDNGPDGDLETALNGGQFEVTVTTTVSFTIPIDTSGLTNIYVSGGNVHTGPYPVLGSFRNQISSYNENTFNASNRVVRGFLVSRPVGAYATESAFEGAYGNNHFTFTGTQSGGVGPSGKTDRQYVLNNTFFSNAADGHFGRVLKMEDWEVRELDDGSGVTWGTDEYKVVGGRLTGLGESTAYDVLVLDDVGPTGAAAILTLRFAGKVSGSATERNHVGEIQWALFFESGTETAVQLSRKESDNGNGHPAEWSIVTANGSSGTGYGKYTLTLTTNSLTGTNNDFFYGWKAELVTSQLEESNLDWDADLSILDGDQGDGP